MTDPIARLRTAGAPAVGLDIHGSHEQSQAVLDDLAALGIDYDDVVQTLEDQGVTAFDASYDHLGRRLAAALGTQKE
jgi:transaldolase